ncbi:hypothetical protein EDF46_2019 [Frondihabitans sp. PhB188]|nr:hypothetical protein EDF46_2019 [Frondihabitans sp. PhB188]
MAAVVVALLVASRQLPAHTILIWSSAGKKGLAASRSDLEIVVVITSLIVIGIWVVASAALAFMPARHILVPHAVYWKGGGRDRTRDMRHRFAIYVSRAIGITFWFLAAEVVAALVSQKNGLLESPWLPVIISILYIIALLVFAVWAFADGFQPPSRAAQEQARRRTA